MTVTRRLLLILLALMLAACTGDGGTSPRAGGASNLKAAQPPTRVTIVLTWADDDWNEAAAAALERCAALPGVTQIPRPDAMSPVTAGLTAVGSSEQIAAAVSCAELLPRAAVKVTRG